jgi:protein-tyrosine phosphatase
MTTPVLDHADRQIRIEGTHNFRDLGGYPVADGRRTRWRLLMRADAFSDVTERGWAQLAGLSLRTVVDLRDPAERSRDDRGPLAFDGVTRRVPLLRDRIDVASVRDLRQLYFEVVERCGSRVAEAIDHVAPPGALPAVIHCAAGKDRTGLVSGILLSALGAPDEVVAGDYGLSAPLLKRFVAEHIRNRAFTSQLDEGTLVAMLGSPPSLMLEVLAHIRQHHGGAENYLLRNGLPREHWAHLQTVVLE